MKDTEIKQAVREQYSQIVEQAGQSLDLYRITVRAER